MSNSIIYALSSASSLADEMSLEAASEIGKQKELKFTVKLFLDDGRILKLNPVFHNDKEKYEQINAVRYLVQLHSCTKHVLMHEAWFSHDTDNTSPSTAKDRREAVLIYVTLNDDIAMKIYMINRDGDKVKLEMLNEAYDKVEMNLSPTGEVSGKSKAKRLAEKMKKTWL